MQVVDGTGRAAAAGQTVLIRDGRIAAVGPDAEVAVPGGARTVALEGHTVLPGFVGLHDHTFYMTRGRRVQLNFSAPRLYLASGVTTIRTTGAFSPYSELNLKRAIADGREIGPRMYITGPYLSGAGASSQMFQVGTPEDARRVVAYWADEGVDWFKAYTRIGDEELAAAIDEAHRRGVRVTRTPVLDLVPGGGGSGHRQHRARLLHQQRLRARQGARRPVRPACSAACSRSTWRATPSPPPSAPWSRAASP